MDDDVCFFGLATCPKCGTRILRCDLDWMLTSEGRSSGVVRETPGLLLAGQEFAASGWGDGSWGSPEVAVCTRCKTFTFTVVGGSDTDLLGGHHGEAFGL